MSDEKASIVCLCVIMLAMVIWIGAIANRVSSIEKQLTDSKQQCKESKAKADHEKVRANLCVQELARREK